MVVIAGAIAGGALAFDSGNNPGATGANTITWTGQGTTNGSLDTKQCDAQNDPFGANQPYLLWILTVDGGSIQNDSTTPVLHLGGTGSGDYTTTNPSDNSSAHFVTPFFNLSGLTANASINVLTTGNGTWNLTISHGCPGGRTAAAGPTVSKDASGSYDKQYKWTIKKSADQTKVFTAGGASATVNYKVTVSHDDGTVSKVKVTGTIDVNNPDTASETLDSITDEIVDGTSAHVADCSVDTSGGLAVSPGDTKYPYSCDLGDSLPSGDVFNKVTIAWSDQDVGTTQHLAAGSAHFTTPSAINFTANEIDECVTVNDTNPDGPQGQKVCVGDANPTEFDYSSKVNGDAGTCTDNKNTASFTTNDTITGDSADATVTDCQGADLTVSKDATPSFKRTYKWGISKKADTNKVYSAGGGDSGPANYTVSVTHDNGTDSDWAVKGTITITNPNDWEDITLTSLADSLDVSGACSLDTAGPYVVPKSDSLKVGYTCSTADPTDSKNTATANWDKDAAHTPSGSASGDAAVDFSKVTPTIVDGSVDVTDSLHGHLGTVSYTDPSPTDFTYPLTFKDPSGTCTDHKNTATATTSDSRTDIHSNEVTVTDCQGADLTVSKTASGTNTRECSWTISKSGGPSTQTVDAGQPATFNYTVHVAGTCNTVKNVKVTGTITVTNPNDWESITLTSLTDSLDVSGACTVDTSPGLTIPASSFKTYNYSCSPASLSDKLNTATANWDKAAAHTPNGSASGTAPVTFVETLTDNCVNVSDSVDGGTPVSLGSQFCVTAAGGSKDFTYTRTFTGPTAGSCVNHNNIASFKDNSTPQQSGTSNKVTVQVCSYGPRFTPGYWKNHLAPAGAPGCTGLPSGTSCGGSAPFANQDLTEKLGNFSVNSIGIAANIFFNMSCSFSGNASNQNQQAIGCLAGKLLAAKYNRKINSSNPCIDPVIALADTFLKNPPATNVTFGGYSAISINYIGPSGNYTGITSTGTSNNQRQVAIALQNALDAYDNGGGCH